MFSFPFLLFFFLRSSCVTLFYDSVSDSSGAGVVKWEGVNFSNCDCSNFIEVLGWNTMVDGLILDRVGIRFVVVEYAICIWKRASIAQKFR